MDRLVLPLHCKEQCRKFETSIPRKEIADHSPNPNSCVCERDLYSIFPRLICLFCCRKHVDRSWEFNRSQTHECGNWDWGRAISRMGIHKWHFRRSVGSIVDDCYLFLNGPCPLNRRTKMVCESKDDTGGAYFYCGAWGENSETVTHIYKPIYRISSLRQFKKISSPEGDTFPLFALIHSGNGFQNFRNIIIIKACSSFLLVLNESKP